MSLPPKSRSPSGSAVGLPAGSGHHISRMVSRQNVLMGVKLRRRGDRWFASRVTDISQEGCRIATSVRLAPGMQVSIMLPGFDGRRAHVSWVGHHEAGCVFEVPLHPAILDYLIRMSDPKRG